MAAPTVTQIITQIAPISEVLASNDVANGALFGAPINPMWPLQIYIETQSCVWRYNGEEIADGNIPSTTLVNNSNYLYSIICGKYGQIAQSLINPGGVIPTPISGSGYGVPTSSSYTATADGETVLLLKDALGAALPVGTLVIWLEKGVSHLNPIVDWVFAYPYLTLLNGNSMGTDEHISFQYISPVT